MSIDRKYLLWALGYAVVGMSLGIYMAGTHDHSHFVTHAHINLVGFLLSLVYGIIHKLWLGQASQRIAQIQFILHQAGALVLGMGLFLLYGKVFPQAQLDPILAIASITVLAGALLMFYMVLKAHAAKT